jgi:agmatine deiminase
MTVTVAGRMPAETDRHERTLMAWPTATRRADLWRDHLEAARDDYAMIATTIAAYEPVLLVVDPADLESAQRRIDPGSGVDVVPLPIDDSWLRDSGPIVTRTADGTRRAVHFRFNAWGEKFTPYDRDAAIGGVLAAHLGLPHEDAPFVLEGGAIAVDGTGLLVTTERCLLNPNRNPHLARHEIEAGLRTHLGADRVVWLADAIAEDDGTDGHVDNVVAFFAPGRALLQGCDDDANPNAAVAAANHARLTAAGIDVVVLPALPYTTIDGDRYPVPYGNVYACNGAVLVPTAGDPRDDAMLERIGECYPSRDVLAVPGALLAYGGGGVHCITQQVPAESP